MIIERTPWATDNHPAPAHARARGARIWRTRLATATLGLALLGGGLLGRPVSAAAFELPTPSPTNPTPLEQVQVWPDLVVSSYTEGFQQGPGRYLAVTVRNRGSADAGGFYVRYSQYGNTDFYVPRLARGASTTIRFSVPDCGPSGSTTTVDVYGQVREESERNNTLVLPYVVC